MRVVCFLGWYRKAKKKAKKYARKVRRSKVYKGGRWVAKKNPYVRVATYVHRGYRHRKKIKKVADTTYEGGKAYYKKYKSRRRGHTKTSQSGRKRRRGRMYYYRGKRYWKRY